MLSRTASCLFWMARYMERAENLARLLDVSQQLALLPGSNEHVVAMPLDIIDGRELFAETEKPLNTVEVAYFLMLQADSPSSIVNSLRQARENAHVVRGTITSELWEAVNTTWLEMRQITRSKLHVMGFSRFLEWVKERSHLYRGVMFGTSLRNDAFQFSRFGTYLERADNTTRLFRYHLEAFAAPDETGRPSYYAWAALLRSLSAFESYRDSCRDSLSVDRIGELLVLREDLPRSLLSCFAEMNQSLELIKGDQGREARRLVAEGYARLRYANWEADFAEDPVAALDQLVIDIAAIGESVAQAFWADA